MSKFISTSFVICIWFHMTFFLYLSWVCTPKKVNGESVISMCVCVKASVRKKFSTQIIHHHTEFCFLLLSILFFVLFYLNILFQNNNNNKRIKWFHQFQMEYEISPLLTRECFIHCAKIKCRMFGKYKFFHMATTKKNDENTGHFSC